MKKVTPQPFAYVRWPRYPCVRRFSGSASTKGTSSMPRRRTFRPPRAARVSISTAFLWSICLRCPRSTGKLSYSCWLRWIRRIWKRVIFHALFQPRHQHETFIVQLLPTVLIWTSGLNLLSRLIASVITNKLVPMTTMICSCCNRPS